MQPEERRTTVRPSDISSIVSLVTGDRLALLFYNDLQSDLFRPAVLGLLKKETWLDPQFLDILAKCSALDSKIPRNSLRFSKTSALKPGAHVIKACNLPETPRVLAHLSLTNQRPEKESEVSVICLGTGNYSQTKGCNKAQ
ncbi:hypothetical protein RRG08_065290 [Elysia crispata]|uniref:Uncharacterized protein n=1 Tax=Elysia crispata TaxID=231223 RepID=A0AAE1D1J1_9GAST|nr:hypothetical protein RRG08_065290 [Elysia crispata]